MKEFNILGEIRVQLHKLLLKVLNIVLFDVCKKCPYVVKCIGEKECYIFKDNYKIKK